MIRKTLFKRTMDTLYKAYKNGHLIHDSPCGCAVGNMVLCAMDEERFQNLRLTGKFSERLYKVSDAIGISNDKWMSAVPLGFGGDRSEPTKREFNNALCVDEFNNYSAGKHQIDLTGYTQRQIWKIEEAFERCRRGRRKIPDATGLQGFLNVIEALGEIHKAPEVAQCLKEAVINKTYDYETKSFKEFHKK